MKSSAFPFVVGTVALVASLVACSPSSPSTPPPTGAAGSSAAGTAGPSAGTAGGGAGNGAAGATGAAGAIGVAGTTGAAGSGGGAGTGAAGTNGAAGTTGAAGAAGTTGAAGATGAAGVTGAAGATGTAGVTGAAGAAGNVEPAAKPSAGCGKPPAIAKGQFVVSTVAGRSTWVRLPPNYDPSRPYPVIFVWKGCGGGGVVSFGLETVAGNEAIIASGDFPPGLGCYDTADGAKWLDLPMFDALLTSINTNYCADQAHVFSAGFSSGAWLTFLLGCQRGNVLRGIATSAGGYKPSFLMGAATCPGGPLSALMASDYDDHENPFFDEDNDGDSVEIGLNHWLPLNGCTETKWTVTAGTPTTPDMNVCRSYAGCGRFPVKLCLTKGKGHSAQDGILMPGAWDLFKMSLPK